MARAGRNTEAEGGAALSIGALARATGIAVETLRTWESRYGFPRPERKPSGHRVYPLAAVQRLRWIAHALSLGHRAGQVVPASDEALRQLLSASPAPADPALPGPAEPASDLAGQLDAVRRFDGEAVARALVGDWARLGPVEFLESRAAPLIQAVGEAWQRGELEVRHEHFLSERLGELLSTLRLPLEERARGPLVAFTTLPGERHGLGLQMAAVTLAAAGCRGLYLGTETPLPQIAALARDARPRAVAVSVSRSSEARATASQLLRLRRALPRSVRLLVGGAGAPAARSGIEVVSSLRELDAWGRRLALGLPASGA